MEIFSLKQIIKLPINLFGDLQLRNVHYKANATETGLVNDNFNFF
jgi:iron complex outermembrane receptor protein